MRAIIADYGIAVEEAYGRWGAFNPEPEYRFQADNGCMYDLDVVPDDEAMEWVIVAKNVDDESRVVARWYSDDRIWSAIRPAEELLAPALDSFGEAMAEGWNPEWDSPFFDSAGFMWSGVLPDYAALLTDLAGGDGS